MANRDKGDPGEPEAKAETAGADQAKAPRPRRKRSGSAGDVDPPAAAQPAPKRQRTRKATATTEIAATEPERAPLPDPTGLAHTLSPVDLPEPPIPLPHGLRWATIVIAVATIVLALLNAHSLRGWSYQLAPNAWSAQVVTVAEKWYDIADRFGLNRPVEVMHGGWQSLKDKRFGGEQAPPTESAQR